MPRTSKKFSEFLNIESCVFDVLQRFLLCFALRPATGEPREIAFLDGSSFIP